MDINRMLGAWVGAREAENLKLVELKVGQVVRGIVLQMLSEQDALVNIAGTPVRAKLETPLPQGRVTLLQVQPQSSSGQIVLKPLTDSGLPIPDLSLKEIAKNFGLTDSESNRILLKELHAAGIPLEARTIRLFQSAMDTMSNVSTRTDATLEQWTESAIVAFKKGLPLKAEIIGALHRVLFGKPAGAIAADLHKSLQVFLSSENDETVKAPSIQLAQKLLAALDQMDHTLQRSFARPEVSETANSKSPAAPAAPESASRHAGTPVKWPPLEEQGEPARSDGSNRSTADESEPELPPIRVMPTPLKQTAIEQPGTRARSDGSNNVHPDGAESTRKLPLEFAKSANAAIGNRVRDIADTSPMQSAPDKANTDENLPSKPVVRKEPWLRALFKHIGLNYERKAFEAFSMRTLEPDSFDSAKESIKGLILQLQADDSLPPALKESLQQTLQHITGQQLLLGGEKGAPISFLTMVIPMGDQGTDSEQAAVQIQARRNKGGQLDSDNCRLWFDLHMRQMGNTLIDVHVMNRIVSLQVHNDHPLVVGLLEAAKSEIETALVNIGYQFVSLKHLPYPVQSQSTEDHSVGKSLHSSLSAATMEYRSQSYKGVDLRI